MTDYTRGTGSSGTMMIRDTGSAIEFWLNANNSTTWSDHIPWSGTVNGSGVSGSFYYRPNSGWQRLGVWGVSSSQNVTFNLGNTGTGGFGGPTPLGPVFINRASIPSAPSPPSISAITSTSVHATFTDGANNGAAIDDRMIGWGTDPADNFQHTVHSNNTDISGLTPGTKYYFWSVTHNSQGWSAWSSRVEVTTTSVPPAPSAPLVSDLTQVSLLLTYNPNGDGGVAINSYDIGYSTSPSAPTTIVGTGDGVTQKAISGLSPGTTYYFWVRAKNIVGAGPWSESTIVMTIAGAWVKVGAIWKPAVPYVRTGGVWKVARPWSRIAGDWKETI